eukprot:233786_1
MELMEEYVAEMQEAYLRNQSTHVKTVAQTDRLINMGRQKPRKKRSRNVKIKSLKCTADLRKDAPSHGNNSRYRHHGMRRWNWNTISHEHDQFRCKWGPSITINHHNFAKYRYPLSKEWAHSNVSTKSRNASTKRSIKQSKTDRSHSWYSKKR